MHRVSPEQTLSAIEASVRRIRSEATTLIELAPTSRELQPAAADVLRAAVQLEKECADLRRRRVRDLDLVRMELATLCDRIAAEIGASLTGRTIRVTGDRPVVGTWEPGLVHRMLYNLLGNSAEHGFGEIEIHLERRPSVVIRVTRAGDPFIPEPRELVCAGPPPESATALSYRIAAEVAQRHGGTLRVFHRRGANVAEARLPAAPAGGQVGRTAEKA